MPNSSSSTVTGIKLKGVLVVWNHQKYVFILYQSCIIVEDSIISLCDRQVAIADSRQLKSMRFG